MIIHNGIDDLPPVKNAVVTSGTFDGVHLGHRQILKRLQQTAKQISGESVVLTFWPHPRLVLYPEDGDNLKLLNTFDEKAALLSESGIDHLIRIPFTKQFSQLSSQDFIQKILIDKLNTRKLVIGYDHKFGRNREGSFEHLKANSHLYGFEIEEIPRQDIEEIGISSTLIRNSLLKGKVEVSNQYLKSSYTLSGEVIEGNKIGRTIGFPTANISIESPHKLVPAIGVYAVLLTIDDKRYKGMLNIGFRPTLEGTTKTIEVHIFDFNEDIYSQNITIHFIKRIRDEVKFTNKLALTEQLTKDKILAIDILKD